MPLNIQILIDGIRRFTDVTFPAFEKFPASDLEAAKFWARAFEDYVLLQAVPPPGGPVYSKLASGALETALKGLSLPGAALVIFPGAFALAALAIVGASVPVTLPPPAPLVIPPLPPVNNATLAATTIATAVHVWFQTGLFGILPAPPVPPWS